MSVVLSAHYDRKSDMLTFRLSEEAEATLTECRFGVQTEIARAIRPALEAVLPRQMRSLRGTKIWAAVRRSCAPDGTRSLRVLGAAVEDRGYRPGPVERARAKAVGESA